MNKILELIEQQGDVFDFTKVKGVTDREHCFISISEDDSRCVMLTHSTGKNRNGRVPEGTPEEVLHWYVTCNFAVGDKKLIYLDISQLINTSDNFYLIGGGCIDCTRTYEIDEKHKIADIKPEAFGAINSAMTLPSLRGLYWDNQIKNVYNKHCYEMFIENRLHNLQQNKNFIKVFDVSDKGIIIEWFGEEYVDKARQELEMVLATPHYNVYTASDARSKGNLFFRISK